MLVSDKNISELLCGPVIDVISFEKPSKQTIRQAGIKKLCQQMRKRLAF